MSAIQAFSSSSGLWMNEWMRMAKEKQINEWMALINYHHHQKKKFFVDDETLRGVVVLMMKKSYEWINYQTQTHTHTHWETMKGNLYISYRKQNKKR